METTTLPYGFFHLPSEEGGEPFHTIKETENYIADIKNVTGKKVQFDQGWRIVKKIYLECRVVKRDLQIAHVCLTK